MSLTRSTLGFAILLTLAGCPESRVTAAQDSSAARPAGPKTVKFDPKALDRLGIKVEPAGLQTGALDLEVPGSLEYNLDKYAEVGTLVDGRVTAINVKPGDKVKKGQVLATIVVPSIAAAQAEYLAAEASAKIAQDNASREAALLDKQLTTAREAEIAKGEALKTEAELGAAKAKLQALGVGRPTGGSHITGAGTLLLNAPLDGVVVRRDAILGRFLQAKESAFVIADPLDLRASLNVYEADIPYFQVGQEAEISFDAMPGKTVKGKIVLIEPQVGKASRSARAFIDVPNADGSLRPGMFLRASLRLPESAGNGRLLVPAPSVQPIGDDDVVFVEISPGVFEVRKVAVARRTTQVAEIREGLQHGERIAVDGAFILRGEVTKQ
ncbi:MAG: efflux RND transporter periplasmic adaptor subunit [Labilithrix sp.]|nr:efflux RND transporter periplasmic adaptor subunit [Labilithrix sp.]